MRPQVRRILPVVLGALALVPIVPAAAEEVSVEVGWWSSNPAATAPDRGFAVSATAGGTVTVAALRAPLEVSTIESATLTLTEEGGVQRETAQLQVCPTPNAWKGGAKQPIAEAPKPECDVAKAPLTRAPDGSWTADVRTVLSSSSAGDPSSPSLMVVPVGAGAVPVGFEVRFAPPKLDVTGPSGSSGSSSPSGPSSSFADDFAPPGGASSPASASFDAPSSSASTFSAVPDDRSPLSSFSSAQVSGTFEASPTAQDTAAAAATAAPPAGEVAAQPTTGAVVAARTTGGGGSRVVQALFFVLVASVLGIGAGLAHARLRPEVELLR
jgi:hypothetical protein